MIAKILRGARTYGLLRYLYGPGKHEEHLDPHLVASWSGNEPDPARVPEATLQGLAELLDQPVRVREMELGRSLGRHVWHCPIRAAPTDRLLSDAEWAEVARETVSAAGLARLDDDGACRWVAIRHADDHIHIVATLARSDGGTLNHHNDAQRIRVAMRAVEDKFGLRSTAPADRTASRAATRQELGKASRRGGDVARLSLQQTVRAAAVAATDEADFFDRLEKAGLRVRKRGDPSSGAVVGYAVAQPGDRNASGDPIWFSGSRLAPDLSLPKVRARWNQAPAPADAGKPVDVASLPVSERAAARAEAWHKAANTVHDAARNLGDAGDAEGAATVAALGDLLTCAAQQAPASVRRQLNAAARQFERAGRAPAARQAASSSSANLQLAVRSLEAAGRALGSQQEGAAAFIFVVGAIAAVMAAHRWHQSRKLTAQASAAASAGAHLRMAAGLTVYSGDPAAPFDSRAAETPRFQHAARTALAGHVDPEVVLSDPAWPALAYTLRKAELRGHSPAKVLAEVAGERTLDGVRSSTEILTWRMQRRLVKDAHNAAQMWAKYGIPVAEAVQLRRHSHEALQTPELAAALRAADAGGMDVMALCRSLETRYLADIGENRTSEDPRQTSLRAAAEIRDQVDRFHADASVPQTARDAWDRYRPIVEAAVGDEGAQAWRWRLRTAELVEVLQRAEGTGLDLAVVCADAVAAEGGQRRVFDREFPGAEAYAEALAAQIAERLPASARPGTPTREGGDQQVDSALLLSAAELIIAEQWPSRSMVQRKLKISHDEAGTLMDGLQNAGVISPVAEGTPGHRDILMDAEEARAVLS
ncbi:MAG: DNA translocase FtsK, partial [Mycobacterium sp.]